MPDQSLCVDVCQQSGWLGELVVLVLLAARTLYVQWRNRQLKTETTSLQAKVEQLSLRPPAGAAIPVTLTLAPNPGLHTLLSPEVTSAPADPQKQASNSVPTGSGSPESSDPDWAEPPKDEP